MVFECMMPTTENNFAEYSGSQIVIPLKDEALLLQTFMLLPKWKLGLISKTVSEVRKRKYARNKNKRGNLPKHLNDDLIFAFFEFCDNDLAYKAFLFMLFFGLRPCEFKDIEYVEALDCLKINNTKVGRVEYLPCHGNTRLLMRFVSELHSLRPALLTSVFRRVMKRFNYVYASAEDGSRPLNLLTAYSFRHTAIKIFSEVEVDLIKRCAFSRHKSEKLVGSIGHYIKITPDDIRLNLNVAFKEYYFLIDEFVEGDVDAKV